MLIEKPVPTRLGPLEFEKELQNLYARRDAIDTLIESLEVYERQQPKPIVLFRPRKNVCA